MPRARRAAASFYRKAYGDNLTGLSAMVAYNLLLSLLPLALVALFIAGRVLSSPTLEHSVLADLERVFPTATQATIRHALERVKSSSTSFGLLGIAACVWFGSSFWGSLDTAFCRIYRFRCRSWLEQKRFALAMLVVVLALMAATVLVPALQSILVAGAKGLPFGLAHVHGFVYALTLSAGLALLFLLLAVVYWAVPNAALPWAAIWPGALAATLAIGVVDYSFPLYLSNVSTIAHLGSTLVFIVIVLLWFYALALIMLSGAIVNALRLDRRRAVTALASVERPPAPRHASAVALDTATAGVERRSEAGARLDERAADD